MNLIETSVSSRYITNDWLDWLNLLRVIDAMIDMYLVCVAVRFVVFEGFGVKFG